MTLKTRVAVSATILILAIGVAVGLRYLKKQPAQRPATKSQVVVSVAPIQSYDGPISLELTGLVVPFREINMVAEVTGRVVFKSEEFRAGSYVKAGTLLLRIDQTDYDLEIARLEADMQQSASSLAELEVEIRGAKELVEIATHDLALQQLDFERKRDSDAGFSQAELDQAQRQIFAAQNALATQVNRLQLLEQSRNRLLGSQTMRRTDLEMARIRRARCLITAPADGVIVQENVELDGYVQPGFEIMIFEDTSRAEVRCNLRPDQLEWLWRHSVAPVVEAEGGPGAAYRIPQVPVQIVHGSGAQEMTWQGRLDRYDGLGIDDRTKTIPCRIVVPEPIVIGPMGVRALVRGMFVRLRIELPTLPLRERNQFFALLPSASLLPGNQVWLYRDQRLVLQDVNVVNTLEQEGQRQVIIMLTGDGLHASDQVVTSPVGAYGPEMAVRVVPLESAAAAGSRQDAISGAEKTRLTSQSLPSDVENQQSTAGLPAGGPPTGGPTSGGPATGGPATTGGSAAGQSKAGGRP